MIGPDPYGTAETASTEAFYFEDQRFMMTISY